MDRAATRPGSIAAGAIAGVAGLAVFLVLHHAWIAPIWFVAPVGVVVAAGAGATMGGAYFELQPRLPGRPWTAPCVMAVASAVLAPAVVMGELAGPICAIDPDGGGTLLVPGSDAAIAVVGLLGSATVTGGLLGAVIGRTRRAAAATAVTGFGLAVGPGHNIPLLGGSPAATMELVILVTVGGVASLVLVVADRLLAGSTRLDA